MKKSYQSFFNLVTKYQTCTDSIADIFNSIFEIEATIESITKYSNKIVVTDSWFHDKFSVLFPRLEYVLLDECNVLKRFLRTEFENFSNVFAAMEKFVYDLTLTCSTKKVEAHYHDAHDIVMIQSLQITFQFEFYKKCKLINFALSSRRLSDYNKMEIGTSLKK